MMLPSKDKLGFRWDTRNGFIYVRIPLQGFQILWKSLLIILVLAVLIYIAYQYPVLRVDVLKVIITIINVFIPSLLR